MRIAYLINQYPKVSHSFIRREILAIERRGVEVMRIALRGWDLELVDPQDINEHERTRFVLRNGALALLPEVLRVFLTRPARLLRALLLAWRMARQSNRPLPIHLAYLAEACRVVSWLHAGGIHHVHAHFGTNSAEVAMLTHELGGPPWSFTVHGSELLENPQAIGLPEKLSRCTFAVAVSSFGRAQLYRLVQHRHWPKIQLVHCGLERSFYEKSQTAVPSVPRLVCVGRLSEEKGQLLLIAAAARLAAEGVEFELVLAGDGPLRSEIEAAIDRHELNGRVRVTGWIGSDQVRNEILASRALVLPSFSEGLPVVIMEAMALARPVIATYVGGIPELVRPGEHGWLVPASDVSALADAIRSCLETPVDTLRRMGTSARGWAIEYHNVDTEAGRLAALFEHQSKSA